MLPTFDRNTQIPVLCRDAHLVAVHKPAGMVVHPTDLARQEKVSLMGLVRRITGQKVWPVHRLDRPTSGLVLFALNKQAASEFGRQFREHQVKKSYLALVRGVPSDQLIDHPIRERPLFRDDMVRAEPLEAVTRLRLLQQVELPVAVGRYPTSRYALVELSPVTGRRHQLRRHMKHISHPIIGDTTYGDGVHNRYMRAWPGGERLLLAAVQLSIRHPVDGSVLEVKAPLQESFARVLERLGIDYSGELCC